ncbi:MAG: ATP-dependent Clp protease ATP-binding subunit ClpX, partial [Acidimicrobiales bacterium]
DDLIEYGMIPEVVGRLPVIAPLRPLSLEAMVNLLTEPKNALLKQYQKTVSDEDVELEFADDALVAVADLALLRGTGARGLRAILEEVLLDVMYDIPGRTDVGKVLIDREVVLDKVNPTIVPRDTKASRPKRAAS